jgi:hypothetical protein
VPASAVTDLDPREYRRRGKLHNFKADLDPREYRRRGKLHNFLADLGGVAGRALQGKSRSRLPHCRGTYLLY